MGRKISGTLAGLIIGSAMPAAMGQGLYPSLAALRWQPATPVLPKGAQISVLSGDPTKSGPFSANMNHVAWTKAPAIIQVEAEGPFEFTYANPADDPSKKP